MLEKVLAFSIRQRWSVIVVVLCIAGLGIYNFTRLPIDAVPDITNVQVQINTEASGYTPFEVEQRITFPIETGIAGIPHMSYSRSISRYGLSQITVVFEDGTDIFFARQLLTERLQEVRSQLPEGISSTLGPISTGLGEVFMWSVKNDTIAKSDTTYSLSDLRTIQDWIVKPQLKSVRGVAEINTIGGYEKQYHIQPDIERMNAHNITFQNIIEAVNRSSQNIGAGYIERNGQQFLVRVPGQIYSLDEIRNITIRAQEGIPVRISDIASIEEGKELRTGAATIDGKETVLGTVFMLIGENSRTVSSTVSTKMKDIQKSLPKGVIAKPVYDRSTLVDATIATVEKNLFEGALLVIVILFIFLGNIRAALVVSLVIPFSMLFTITGMVANKISGNLLSLGAIDFGIIVDGSIIIVENCMKKFAEAQHKLGRVLTPKERMEYVLESSKEVRGATMFGELIIMVVYLPILTLQGVEGKMFIPMAATVVLALGAAVILSLTYAPAALSIFITGKVSEKENIVIRIAKKIYEPTLEYILRSKKIITIGITAILISTVLIWRSLGSEFLPVLDEGDIAIHALRIPGTSLSQAIEMQHAVETALASVPEVKHVFAKIGTAEVATDPMPPNVADVFVIMKPKKEWKDQEQSKEEIKHKLEVAVQDIPGNKFQFLQPIQMRFNELLSGIRADVGIKIFGDDMNELRKSASRVAELLKATPGSSDVEIEQTSGLPLLTVQVDREALARFGLTPDDVQSTISTAIGGQKASTLLDGDRRFDIVVRLSEKYRTDVEAIKNLPISLPNSVSVDPTIELFSQESLENTQFIPLSSVATISISEGPNQISRENGKRLIVVAANVKNRDLGSFVKEAQEKISSSITLPSGYWINWGGQFQQLQEASSRLAIVVPIALLLVIFLLYLSVKRISDALLIFSCVPLAMTGGVVALWIRDIPFSISAGVGFIALSGMAVLNGLVMISFINHKMQAGEPLLSAVRHGALDRLRPVLMTALVAALGFIPMAISTSVGSEVQRPLASVVIGGIISSTALTLIVLPVLYTLIHQRRMK